jgi:hypothetical protein
LAHAPTRAAAGTLTRAGCTFWAAGAGSGCIQYVQSRCIRLPYLQLYTFRCCAPVDADRMTRTVRGRERLHLNRKYSSIGVLLHTRERHTRRPLRSGAAGCRAVATATASHRANRSSPSTVGSQLTGWERTIRSWHNNTPSPRTYTSSGHTTRAIQQHTVTGSSPGWPDPSEDLSFCPRAARRPTPTLPNSVHATQTMPQLRRSMSAVVVARSGV